MGKIKLLGATMCAGLTFAWAAPAMAQSEGGIEGPPEAGHFYTPQNFDTGVGCSRQRPKECTPEQRDSYNEIVSALCAMGGGAVGILDGVLVTWVLTNSVVGAPAAPVAGPAHGMAVTTAVYTACYSNYKIPNI